MKVTVGNYAWFDLKDLSPARVAALKAALTILPEKAPGYAEPEVDDPNIYLWEIRGDRIGVAREFFLSGKRTGEYEIEHDLSEGAALPSPFAFSGTLRPEQSQAIMEVGSRFKRGQLGGIVQAPCGSGKCLTWNTQVTLADTGERVAVGSLIGKSPAILSLLVDGRVGSAQASQVWLSGKKLCLRLTLASGQWLEASADHPVLTQYGWKPLSELKPDLGFLVATVPNSCVSWEAVRSLEDCGVQEVVDLTVPETGNVVANGIVVHNTVLACAFIAAMQLPTLVVVHKEFLMNQWEERIRAFLPGAKVGRVQQDVLDYRGKHIVLGMVHTLASRALPEEFWRWAGLYVVDECFPAGTMVATPRGPVAIECLQEGASIYSAAGEDRVVACFPARAVPLEDLRLLRLRNGKEIVCTKKHPYLTKQGWRCAAYLQEEALVTFAGSTKCFHGEREGELFDVLSRELRVYVKPGAFILPPEFEGLGAVEYVERVSIPEPADLERLGIPRTRTGGVLVYNLHVDKHPSYVLADSGVVVHNCHRVGARTWSATPGKSFAKYRLGLTATPRRKDGAEKVFEYHLGPILFRGKAQQIKPKIRRVYTSFRIAKADNFNPGLAPKALLVRFLVMNEARNTTIAQQVILALKAGRKCLVLSERLPHLDALQAKILKFWGPQDGPVPTFGKYVGGRSKKELEVAQNRNVVLATTQFASEGLDIADLDTLFLTTPMSDVEQAVGRILRKHDGKKEAIVVDFRDDEVPMFKAMAESRERIYAKLT